MSTKACKADLLLINGKIIIVDAEFSTKEAVAVKDGKIMATGSTKEMKKLKGDETEVINLKGKTVLPGLYDSHLHMLNSGATLQVINCRTPPMKSIADMAKAVGEKAKKAKPGEWIVGRGWDQVKLAEHRNPTRYDFDKVAPNNPVYLTRTCGHLAVVNSKALELANITKKTKDPVGGRIVRDENGESTGMLEESPAMGLCLSLIPPATIEDKVLQIKAASDAFNAVGITSVIEAGITEDEIVAYQLAMERGLLNVRVSYMLRAIDQNEPEEKSIQRIEHFPMISGYGNDMLRFQGLKILIDGGIGGKTALLREPYENDTRYGLLTVPETKLQHLVDAANKRGILSGIHCCGGKAMDIVIDAFKKTDKIKPIKGRRFYLIHAYQPSEENFKDCKKYGILVASQPDFLYYLGDSYVENVGIKRGAWLKPHRAWIDEGIMVAAGTDSPVTPYPPFPCLWASVARKTELKKTVMGAEQRVTREEAIRMYTVKGAYLSFEENIKGSIEPGKLADMIIIDRDILTCQEDDIKDTRVLRTILGGKTVYKA
ncbi:MAG: amidohydrolase [Candidatus Bathyarchaeota archaeon]|nr:amidohydrolase [Candidatus Bathyarchaeota archaeon]